MFVNIEEAEKDDKTTTDKTTTMPNLPHHHRKVTLLLLTSIIPDPTSFSLAWIMVFPSSSSRVNVTMGKGILGSRENPTWIRYPFLTN